MFTNYTAADEWLIMAVVIATRQHSIIRNPTLVFTALRCLVCSYKLQAVYMYIHHSVLDYSLTDRYHDGMVPFSYDY